MLRKFFARQSPNLNWEDFKAVHKLIKTGVVFQDSHIQKFKEAFSNYAGLKYVEMLNMGRAAEWVALKALGLSAGDEIIMPSYNFPIVPIIVKILGLKPVFVDVEPDTFNIDPSQIGKNITPKTKAIFLTHMCGQPCEMDKIMEIKNRYGLKLIEDTVHSLGAKYKNKKAGTFGDISYFSFYVGKTMTTFMGAAVGTNSLEIYTKIKDTTENFKRLSRNELYKKVGYGILTYLITKPAIFWLTVYPLLIYLNMFNSHILDEKMEEEIVIPKSESFGYLTKFTNLQAALGLSQLKRLDMSISRRVNNSNLLSLNIKPNPLILLPAVRLNIEHAFLYYLIRCKNRDKFRKSLIFRGVDTKRDTNKACSHLDIFKEEQKYCPISEAISRENTLIPNYPSLSKNDILYIANAINQSIEEITR